MYLIVPVASTTNEHLAVTNYFVFRKQYMDKAADAVMPLTIYFPLKREDQMKQIHTKLFKTITQVIRWGFAGIFLVIFALPAIATFNSSI